MQSYDRQKQTKQDSRNRDNLGYSGTVFEVSYPSLSPLSKPHPLSFSQDIV